MKSDTRFGFAGLGAALALSLFWGGPLKAQEETAPQAGGPASTITLTKVVPVYGNLEVQVDQYQVVAGDTLAKILKARGLGGPGADQARLMRLVRELNPELKDLNRLAVGQTLNLPASDAMPTAGPAASVPPPRSPGTTEPVKIYERAQANQQAARVVVLRHQGEAQAPAEPDEAAATAAAPPAPAEAVSALPGTSAEAGGGALNFPSGNIGPLARDRASQVVYRTVKIRPGDTLERLLRREGLPRRAIYGHLLKITMYLNPQIKNPDLILAGAELRIPAAGEYLATAGLDPLEIRAAALAISQRRRPAPVRVAAGMAENVRRLPEEEAETAKNTLVSVFNRLGDRVENQGGLRLAGAGEDLELDTRNYPVVHTLSGVKLVLDLGSTLPQSALAALRSQNFRIFRTRRGEPLDLVLDRLWSLCRYYRVYTKEHRPYEGGGDVLLKISADWMVWPTGEAWNSGRPLVFNKVVRGGRGTDPAWVRFLGDHGLMVLDLERNLLRPVRETAAGGQAAVSSVTTLDSANPRFLAAELVRLFGAEPHLAAPVEIKNGPAPRIVTAPLHWEVGGRLVALNFGELSADEAAGLQKNGFMVIAVGPGSEAVVEAVLTGFGLKAQENLVLTAPLGGPSMSLTIKGRLVTVPRARRKFLLTYAALPQGLVQLLDPELKIIRY
jgi:nucleoid-associated protein YgaU